MTGLKLKNGTITTGGVTIQPVTNSITSKTFDYVIPKPRRVPKSTINIPINNLSLQKSKILAEKGINSFRPEILLTAEFLPAYFMTRGTDRLTPAGNLLDVQINAREFQLNSLNNLLSELRGDEEISALLNFLESKYTDQLQQAGADVQFLFNTWRGIDAVRRQFDIYGNIYEIRNKAQNFITNSGSRVFDIRSLFTDYLGFSEDGFNNFTNTKILGQLLFDLGNATKNYTPHLFEIIDADRPRDRDPVKYDRTHTLTNGKFTFKISNYSRSNRIINAFDRKVFSGIITSLPSNTNDKIKLLSTVISKVLTTSSILGKSEINNKIQQLGINSNSPTLFDDIIGVPSNAIFDNPSNLQSILKLLVIDQPDNNHILPFEMKQIIDIRNNTFIPGHEYFFDIVGQQDKFDISRLITFKNTFSRKMSETLDIVEAAIQADTTYAAAIWGQDKESLRAEKIFNYAIQAASSILKNISNNKVDDKYNAFVLATFQLANNDKQLKNLLFQLMLLSVVWNDMNIEDASVNETIDNILLNEIKVYNDLSSLNNFIAQVQLEGQKNEFPPYINTKPKNIGLDPITKVENIAPAYRQLQKIIIDRVFLLLTNKGVTATKLNFVGKLQGLVVESLNAAPQFTTNVLSQKTVINIAKPDDVELGEYFGNVLLQIAKFIDNTEDIAGANRQQHVTIDRRGLTRGTNISSSVRSLFAFELISSLLNYDDFMKFGNVIDNKHVEIIHDSTKLQTFLDVIGADQKNVTTTIQTNINTKVNLSLLNEKNAINESLRASYEKQVDDIRQSLLRDRQIIESMCANLRAIIANINGAIDDIARTLDVQSSAPVSIATFAPRPTFVAVAKKVSKKSTAKKAPQRVRSTQQQFGDALRAAQAARGGATSSAPARAITSHTYLPIVADPVIVDANEKRATKLLLSKQQSVLAMIRLNEILRVGSKDTNYRKYFTTQDDSTTNQSSYPFVDDLYPSNYVRTALWAMLADTQFRKKDMSIVSVGLPTGMISQLETSDRIKLANFKNTSQHESDIIDVNVHKKDLIEDDIIFIPQKFVFEASRFVTAGSFIPQSATTQLKNSYKEIVRHNVEFFDASTLDINTQLGQFASDIVIDPSYTFLGNTENIMNMLNNHVMSYLLGMYMQVLLGIDTAESAFLMEKDIVNIQENSETENTFNEIAEILAAKSGLNMTIDQMRAEYPAFDQLISNIVNSEQYSGILEKHIIADVLQLGQTHNLFNDKITSLGKLFSSRSILTAGEKQRRTITSPKLFERVFNMVVDPTSFEIDIAATKKTRAGSYALQRLEKSGRLRSRRDKQSGQNETIRYFIRQNQNDISCVEYYCSISRH